jgi:CheY-like chemotaxis protein
MTILIVDDEPIIAELIAEVLDTAGYRALVAHNGRAALEFVRYERPALVLTDNMMPEVGGVDLVRRLRDNPDTRAIPVALMSSAHPHLAHQCAHAARSSSASCKTDTAASTQYAEIDGELVPFLPKPFELDDLLALVATLARAPRGGAHLQPTQTH